MLAIFGLPIYDVGNEYFCNSKLIRRAIMKKVCRMLVLSVLTGLLFCGMLWAENGDRGGTIRGIFVRLVERALGEQEYMGIVVKPFESDDHITVLVPRQQEELGEAVRMLQEGQEVRIAFVREDEQMWVKGLEAEQREVFEERPQGRRRTSIRKEVLRYEGDQERPEPKRPIAHLEQMERQLKEVIAGHLERVGRALKEVLAAHLERMEAELREHREHIERMQEEIQELRAENERLRRQLRERAGPQREREVEVRMPREGREREEGERIRERDERRESRGQEEPDVQRRSVEQREIGLPDGMAGFRGVLIGRILRKLDRGFVLKVETVDEIWEDNRADNPQAAIGKELIITIRANEERGERFLNTLRTLEINERVLVEAFHFEGEHLTVVEQLQKAE